MTSRITLPASVSEPIAWWEPPTAYHQAMFVLRHPVKSAIVIRRETFGEIWETWELWRREYLQHREMLERYNRGLRDHVSFSRPGSGREFRPSPDVAESRPELDAAADERALVPQGGVLQAIMRVAELVLVRLRG